VAICFHTKTIEFFAGILLSLPPGKREEKDEAPIGGR
ncbi:MAG: hypothetical protein QG577_286, partial [Thermodesulfobacteriota bacterium]|nr:hypothetical protein [Thermodesulfobacteriota bacterium]